MDMLDLAHQTNWMLYIADHIIVHSQANERMKFTNLPKQ